MSIYKKSNDDVTFVYFQHYDSIEQNIILDKNLQIDDWCYQFHDYKTVNYNAISPFIQKYFAPSEIILDKVDYLTKKYEIDVDNCISLYYRGTDKWLETSLGSYETYLQKLNEVMTGISTPQVIIQTDDGNFLDFMKKNCPDKNIIIMEENRVNYDGSAVHYSNTYEQNHVDIQYLFATFLIISKSKHIICSSANGSIWMMFYRGHANNVYQNLHMNWY